MVIAKWMNKLTQRNIAPSSPGRKPGVQVLPVLPLLRSIPRSTPRFHLGLRCNRCAFIQKAVLGLWLIAMPLLWVPGCSSKDEPGKPPSSDNTTAEQAPPTTTANDANDTPPPTTKTSQPDEGQTSLPTMDVTIKGETFHLELALNDDTRIQGLSDRSEIAADGGMLFAFKDAQRREFVMRRCLVPINIVFLDSEGKVVWMHAMQVESDPDMPEYRLKRYDSHYPAQYAIELRDGTLRRLGLHQGDKIDLPLDKLKAQVR